MIEFASLPENFWFSVALSVMLGIAILEGLFAVFGMALSSFLDNLLPELDIDIDGDLGAADVQAPSVISRFLSWLRVGKVPVLMLLVIFLTAFGLSGLLLQSLLNSSLGFLLPSYIAAVPAFLVTLPITRMFGKLLERFMPGDETEVVSEESFVGLTATITLGTAKTDSPAEAKLKDKFGTTHYLMVEPDLEAEQFNTGDEVLLVKKQGHLFRVIGVDNRNLLD